MVCFQRTLHWVQTLPDLGEVVRPRATLDFLKVVRLALRARTIALHASKARLVSKSSATPAVDKLTLIVLC